MRKIFNHKTKGEIEVSGWQDVKTICAAECNVQESQVKIRHVDDYDDLDVVITDKLGCISAGLGSINFNPYENNKY